MKFIIKYYPYILILLIPIIVYIYGYYKDSSFNKNISFTTGKIICVDCKCGKSTHCFTFEYTVKNKVYKNRNQYDDVNYCFTESCIQKEYEIAYDSLDPESSIFIWDSIQKQEILKKSK